MFRVSSLGYGLKCYRCVSTKSWDDCADVKKEVTCSSGFDRCVKAYADVKTEGASVEAYEKGCFTEELCKSVVDKVPFCKGKGECKINCCSGDLCNAAALPMVSTIILITCAFVAWIQ